MEPRPSAEQVSPTSSISYFSKAEQDSLETVKPQPSFDEIAAAEADQNSAETFKKQPSSDDEAVIKLFCDEAADSFDQWHYKAEVAIKHAIIQLKADAYATFYSKVKKVVSKKSKSEHTAIEKKLKQVLNVCNKNLDSALAKIRKLSRPLKDMRANVSKTYLSLVICQVNSHFAFCVEPTHAPFHGTILLE